MYSFLEAPDFVLVCRFEERNGSWVVVPLVVEALEVALALGAVVA